MARGLRHNPFALGLAVAPGRWRAAKQKGPPIQVAGKRVLDVLRTAREAPEMVTPQGKGERRGGSVTRGLLQAGLEQAGT